MGREIRRVPPNWEHPRYTKENAKRERDIGEYISMYDKTYAEAVKEWKEGYAAWEAGTHESLEIYKDGAPDMQYWEYDSTPDRESYRPAFTEEPTWYQVYQTVSEGTPVTPPFPTKEALVEYLVQHGDFWSQHEGRGGFSRAAAEAFVKDEWAPSMIVSNGKVSVGIESADPLAR
jgi:hypothetical protein